MRTWSPRTCSSTIATPVTVRARRLAAAAVSLSLVAGTLTACTVSSSADSDSADLAAAQEDQDTEVSFSVDDDATDVSPAKPLEITSEHGALKSVEMVNESGKVVEAELAKDGTEWSTTEPLGYGRHYTTTVETDDGETIVHEFDTVAPNWTTTVWTTPNADTGEEVGVGQAIEIHFAQPVTDKDAAEEAIEITTSNNTEGGFMWVSDNYLRWRPKEYWKPGTKVDVNVNVYGVDLGDGLYGESNAEAHFTIGEEVKVVVDDKTKEMKIYRSGDLVETMPVSLGTDYQWSTDNGIYVVAEEQEAVTMDSRTFGLALENGGYVTHVQYGTRLSISGIYVHAAPWSMWAQGNTNTSHGCINVSPEDAKRFQEIVKRGDIVEVKNTVGGRLSGWDGLGQWNLDWDQFHQAGKYTEWVEEQTAKAEKEASATATETSTEESTTAETTSTEDTTEEEES